jgi:hypothetical protein
MQLFRTSLLILTAVAAAGPAAAGNGFGVDAQVAPQMTGSTIHQRLAQDDGPTLSDAVERVRRQYNGRIVSAETKRRGNREVHVIKVLTEDGKVKTVTIQGRTVGSRG